MASGIKKRYARRSAASFKPARRFASTDKITSVGIRKSPIRGCEGDVFHKSAAEPVKVGKKSYPTSASLVVIPEFGTSWI
jgi:hypothetical protein